MSTPEGRKRLTQSWGIEVIVKCCREWKTHYGNGKFGVCGICHNTPKVVHFGNWDDYNKTDK